jgi:outer membrane protease
MKTIYAFAFFVSILGTGVFPVSTYGQDAIDFTIGKTPYTVSLAAGGGVLLGHAEEIVYKYSNTDAYLSELLWDLKPMAYLGSSLSFSRADPLAGLGAAADLSVKFGLPLSSGTMEDRDWQNNADLDMLTDFSSHNSYIQGAMLLDISGGISIPIAQVVVIKPMVSFSYMHFSWISKDGYGEYRKKPGGVYSNDWDRITFQGTVITYEQDWLIISPGIGIFWPVHRVFDLDFRFFISPLLWSWDVDTHLLSKTQYHDTMHGGLYLEPVLDFSFIPNRYASLILHSSWRYLTGARGDTSKTTIGASGTSVTSKNQAGVGYSAFDVGLSVKFALPLGLLSKKN